CSLIFFNHQHDLRSFDLFFFNDTATTEIYTLSLHDALPIFCGGGENILLLTKYCRDEGKVTIEEAIHVMTGKLAGHFGFHDRGADRKSTRLNSSHVEISYAVFCLKKKKTTA